MVIDPNSINSANSGPKSRVTGNERAATAKKPVADLDQTASSSRDSVSLSGAAKSLAKLEAAVSAAPDLDRGKVDSVRAAVQSGQYQIDAEAIAARMLEQDGSL